MAKNFQNEEMRNEEFTVEDDSPSEDRDDMVTYFMKLYREYESSEYRRQKIEDAAENRKRYDGDRDSKNFPWENCSNYSLMTEAIVVDNLEPRLVAAVAGKDRDIVEALPNSSKVSSSPKRWRSSLNGLWHTTSSGRTMSRHGYTTSSWTALSTSSPTTRSRS